MFQVRNPLPVPPLYDPSYEHVYDFHLEKTLDEKVLLKELEPAIEKNEAKSLEVDVRNTDRAFGTILGSVITEKLGKKAMNLVRPSGSVG